MKAKEKYNGHGGLLPLREDANRAEYRTEGSDMPRWYRRCTKMYPNKNRTARESGVIVRLGFELLPGNREYTTCAKVYVCRTYIRK